MYSTSIFVKVSVFFLLVFCNFINAMDIPELSQAPRHFVDQTIHTNRVNMYPNKIDTQSLIDKVNIYNTTDFSNGNRDASFREQAKNAFFQGMLTGVATIGASIIVDLTKILVTGVINMATRGTNRSGIISDKNKVITQKQLELEATLIAVYEQQHKGLSPKDEQYQKFVTQLKNFKEAFAAHLTEYFQQNTQEKIQPMAIPRDVPVQA